MRSVPQHSRPGKTRKLNTTDGWSRPNWSGRLPRLQATSSMERSAMRMNSPVWSPLLWMSLHYVPAFICRHATSLRRPKSVQSMCRQGGRGVDARAIWSDGRVDLGTRVQFPPPPLFLNMRLQATRAVRTRLNPLIAVELRRTTKGRFSDQKRQPAAARVPRALPKALPGHYSMTRFWPLS
jgi:hypothetical protein